MDTFTVAYLDAAMWTEGVELRNVSKACLSQMKHDCSLFQAKHDRLIEESTGDWSQAGHDFWLTRNHHGAGFWDGDWPEPQATELTRAAHAFGEFSLYETDDGTVECSQAQN